MYYKTSLGSKIFDVFNYLFMVFIVIVMLYPFLYVLAQSMSDPKMIYAGEVSWYPRGFNLSGYKLILGASNIWIAYKNTILYAVAGTLINLIFTSMMAYPLTMQKFLGGKFITIFLAITMFFSGGMIPTYLLIKNMDMINTFWVMVIPGCISAYNVIVYRTFFKGISSELRESAYIDGANDLVILFKIFLPLSKALLATFALFSVVAHWNSWFNALLYLTQEKRYPIQMILRKILFVANAQAAGDAAVIAIMMESRQVHAKNIQMSVIVLTIAPILCIYPFLQKYFAKGVMIGSIKG